MRIKIDVEITLSSLRRMLEVLYSRTKSLFVGWVSLRTFVALLALFYFVHYHSTFGPKLVAVYMAFAFIMGLDAVWSFGLGLIMMMAVLLVVLLKHPLLANEFAADAFCFLCFGILSSILFTSSADRLPEN